MLRQLAVLLVFALVLSSEALAADPERFPDAVPCDADGGCPAGRVCADFSGQQWCAVEAGISCDRCPVSAGACPWPPNQFGFEENHVCGTRQVGGQVVQACYFFRNGVICPQGEVCKETLPDERGKTAVTCVSENQQGVMAQDGQAPPKALSLPALAAIVLGVILVVAGYAVSASGKPTARWKERHSKHAKRK